MGKVTHHPKSNPSINLIDLSKKDMSQSQGQTMSEETEICSFFRGAIKGGKHPNIRY